MILPKSNISIIMVRNAIGYPSTDLGTLCRCNKVNMWAKYKPVPYNFTSVRPSDWWRGQDRTCGITVDYYPAGNETMMKSVVDDIKAGKSCFTRNIPAGGSSEPFRLGDFAGYNHEATHNVVYIQVPTNASWNNGNQQDRMARITMAVQWRHDSSMLSLSDLYVNQGVFDLSKWYLGCIFTMPGKSSEYRIVTNGTTLADMENVDVLAFNVGGTGMMTIYPIICSVAETTLTSVTGGYVIPLPNLGSYDCEVVQAHRAEIEWNTSSSVTEYGSDYRFSVKINYSNVKTIPNSITGYIEVVPCTANMQPLGNWTRVLESFTINLTAASGVASLDQFTLLKSSLDGLTHPSCRGLLVSFHPTASYMAGSVTGMITI